MIMQDSVTTAKQPFSMIIASDLHFGKETSPYENDVDAIFANWDHVLAMNNIMDMDTECLSNPGGGKWPNPIAKLVGVILNGDLADRWQGPYAKLYKQFYEPKYHQFFVPYMGKFEDNSCRSYSCATDNDCCDICNEMIDRECPSVEKVKYDVFPGYGNHDYIQNVQGNEEFVNNIWECGSPENPNQCAENAVTYMRSIVLQGLAENKNITNFRYDVDSLAYSFDYGSYHFVQLQFQPNYSNADFGISCSMDFLRDDLEKNASGKWVIINMHKYKNDMTCDGRDFKGVIENNNVIAVFSGHTHNAGFIKNIELDSGEEIPLFLSGSAGKNEFLLVNFSNEGMSVGVIKSTSGNPRFKYCIFSHDVLKNLYHITLPLKAQ